jgi:glycosyltransferase involved in cell wall biosynthesis
MGTIILDCDLMRFPNTGLYYYCLNLGHHVNLQLEKQGEGYMNMYMPAQSLNSLNNKKFVIKEKRYHRFFKPFLNNCRVWHAPFQSGRILPSLQSSVKVVLTIHDLNALHEGKSLEEQKSSLAHTQSLIDRSDVLVCISEFTKRDVLKHCDIKNKPIHVIHNGCALSAEPALSPTSYRPQRPFLFALGYVNRKKNFHVLLSLLQREDLELVVAGKLDDPDYVTVMKQQAEALGVLDRLHILGPIEDAAKVWYLKNCHAFCNPSLAEGFGLPVVEAMQFGKPVFLSDKTSLPEVGGNVAFYFRSFDSWHMQEVFKKGMQVYNENGLANSIRERACSFDWSQKALEYINIYKTLL